MYDTRDAKNNVPGPTTIKEAQLIGRGARYCPFKINDSDDPSQRKFDNDIQNEMKICEELYGLCSRCKQPKSYYDWCPSCDNQKLVEYFSNWTSDNEIIDFIQEMQLSTCHPSGKVFEWIPYNQFNNLNVTDKDDFAIVYSAIWKGGSLCYTNKNKKKLVRKSNEIVALKCLYNSQNITEFLNEV